jgi:hypothetical protein
VIPFLQEELFFHSNSTDVVVVDLVSTRELVEVEDSFFLLKHVPMK